MAGTARLEERTYGRGSILKGASDLSGYKTNQECRGLISLHKDVWHSGLERNKERVCGKGPSLCSGKKLYTVNPRVDTSKYILHIVNKDKDILR